MFRAGGSRPTLILETAMSSFAAVLMRHGTGMPPPRSAGPLTPWCVSLLLNFSGELTKLEDSLSESPSNSLRPSAAFALAGASNFKQCMRQASARPCVGIPAARVSRLFEPTVATQCSCSPADAAPLCDPQAAYSPSAQMPTDWKAP